MASTSRGAPVEVPMRPATGGSSRSSAMRTASPIVFPTCCWKPIASPRPCCARHPRPPPRRTGRNVLAIPHLHPQDAAQLIDWRRSASSDHLYVREREWEAAHTLWLWPDLSPSMNFQSHPSQLHQTRPRAHPHAGLHRVAGTRRRTSRPARGNGQPTSSRRASTRPPKPIAATARPHICVGPTPRKNASAASRA